MRKQSFQFQRNSVPQCGHPLTSAQEEPTFYSLWVTHHSISPTRYLTAQVAVEGERKQVTVLFADMKGSMELFADRDPEAAQKLLDPVLEA